MEKIFYLLRVEYEGSINEHTIHYLRVGFPEFGIGGRAVEPDIQSMDDMFKKTISLRSWIRTPDEEEIYAQIHALHNLTSYKEILYSLTPTLSHSHSIRLK